MQNIYEFIKRLIKRMLDDDVFGLSAQLAYFFLLSLFPFMIFLVTLIGYLPIQEIDVLNFIDEYAPEQIMRLLDENLNQIMNNRNGGLLSVGIIGTLWSASNGINAIVRSFNAAYNVEETRSFIASRLIAIVLTVAMLIVIIIAFLLPIFGKAIGVYLFSFIGLSEDFIQVWETLRWVVSSIVFFIVLLALYTLAPNKKIHIKDVAVGAAFATIGWQLVSLAFSFYVNTMGNYSATYGSLGGVIVLMIWFFITGVIIITGGEINALLKLRRKEQNS
ncbi:YihY/virulence factor BrkB family protein [Aquibacillus koreensis]|uniref:YihY/virulence factor BrkB family protein n=1 Tax=Aquibacillus koreensis TaxID=279446 RepID=A0A9X3WQZ6_9BACI|nr:YihY/virulence factor BrkB family protein [Aquibacillus koreensis]MCT2534437.1 YihY/virulence factor BrkB family protein [Aquibacillus koreensis]MDC3421744.1 YihY/virulence factor BrkB family protein [Aquibacillus koreensis]